MRPGCRTRQPRGWGDFEITCHYSFAPKGPAPWEKSPNAARPRLCWRSCRGSRRSCSGACQTLLAFRPGQLRCAAGRNPYRRQTVHRGSVYELAGELSDHALLGCRSARCWSARFSANSRRRDCDNDSCKQCACKADRLAGKPAIRTDVYECKSCTHFLLRVNLVSESVW